MSSIAVIKPVTNRERPAPIIPAVFPFLPTKEAIANHLGKNPQTGGIIGVGLSLLVTGLLTALEDETSSSNSKS